MATINTDMQEAFARSVAALSATNAASLSTFQESRGLAWAATEVAASDAVERIGRMARGLGVGVPTLDTVGTMPSPLSQGFARSIFTTDADAEAAGRLRATDYAIMAGVSVNPCSEVTIARKPYITMDEAISTLLQKISDALPQKASSEYNDAVSDVLEVVEAFRVTQIEPPKVENSKYQDMLHQLGSRVITDIVKEVILAYRYTKLEDNDLLANLKTALNNALRGRVSENTIVTSVHTHVDHIRHQRVVQVRFKIHKDDDLIHTQEISMNVNF